MWEWIPISFMPHGCNEVWIRDDDGNIVDLCSCDYWWMPEEKRQIYTTFRLNA
jgi:hypothetical protein